MATLSGKNVLVIGGSSGIGFAMAEVRWSEPVPEAPLGGPGASDGGSLIQRI